MTTHSNSNNNDLVLKIQVETPGNAERHRKRISAASLTFAQLHALVGSLLPPSAGHADVVITYLDGDLDEIRIKDDGDLHEALLVKDEKNSDTLRLTVKALAEAAPSVATPAPADKRQDGSNNEEGTRPAHGSSSSSSDRRRGCREWRRWGCQKQRPPPASACGFPPFFSGVGGGCFPFPPAATVESLSTSACDGKGKDRLGDILAHSSFPALLRAAADVLEAAKSAASTVSTRELATTLWRRQECQDLVQWLQTHAPELAPLLALLRGALQPQPSDSSSSGSSSEPSSEHASQTVHHGVVCDGCDQSPLQGRRFKLDGHDFDLCEADFAKLSPEEKRRFAEVDSSRNRQQGPAKPPQFNFEDILQHAGTFQHLFGGGRSQRSRRGSTDEVPDEDASLQAAIHRSLLHPHSKRADETGTGLKAEETNAEAPVKAAEMNTEAPNVTMEERASSLSKTANVLAATEPPALEVADKVLHEAEILQLREMGFHDMEAVRAALQSTDGNVQYALARLLLWAS
jgi:hypothetical protein